MGPTSRELKVKRIPLTQDKEALVDDCDYDYLTQCRWYFHSEGYAVRNTRKGEKGRRMHRVVLARTGINDFEQVDHINGDKLDNRRSNLRPATNAENSRNAKVGKNNKTGVKGVSWHRGAGKFQVHIMVNRKSIYLGLYDSLEQASKAYREAAKKYFGDFANAAKRVSTTC